MPGQTSGFLISFRSSRLRVRNWLLRQRVANPMYEDACGATVGRPQTTFTTRENFRAEHKPVSAM